MYRRIDRCKVIVAQLKRTGVDRRTPHMAGSDILEAVLAELKKSFGYSSFKSNVQKRAVLSIAEGKSCKARAPGGPPVLGLQRES